MNEIKDRQKAAKIDSVLLWSSICISSYFTLLFLNSLYFEIDSIAVGIIQEILTIPAMLAITALFIIAVIRRKKSNYGNINKITVTAVISVICVCWLIYAFFGL